MAPLLEALHAQLILRALVGGLFSASELAGADWDLLRRLGEGNAVLIQVAERLTAAGAHPPKDFLEAVERARTRARDAVAVLRQFGAAAARHGVAWLVPKATQRFPDLGDDLDLLVDSRRTAVDALLLERIPAVRRPRSLAHRLAGATVYSLPQGDLLLDIRHARVGTMGEHQRYASYLLQHGRAATLGGLEVLAPSAEDQLVLQGIEKVVARRAFHMSDVAHTADTLGASSLDWDYVLATARAHGADAGLAYYLHYVDEIHARFVGRRVLPPEVTHGLRSRAPGQAAFREGAFRFPALRVSARVYAHEFLFDVRAGRWDSALRLCLVPLVAGEALTAQLSRSRR